MFDSNNVAINVTVLIHGGLIPLRFYTVPEMKSLFDTISVHGILSFVKEVASLLKFKGSF